MQPDQYESIPLHKHTLNLFEGDFEKLQAFYPDLPAAITLRIILRQHLQRIESRVSTEPPKVKVSI